MQQPLPQTIVERAETRLWIAWGFRSEESSGPLPADLLTELAILLGQLTLDSGDDAAADVMMRFAAQKNDIQLARQIGAVVLLRVESAQTLFETETEARWGKALARVTEYPPFG